MPEIQDAEVPKKKAPGKTLAMKLAEACDQVGGIEKLGVNEAQRYKYVKAADVAKAIRHELFQRGIVIISDELECDLQRVEFINAKGEARVTNQVKLKVAYNITDGNETIVQHGFGIAWDAGDKAIYKAKTGALKYFLRGLGLIPDEKDDPEADESIDRAVKGLQPETDEEFDQRTANQQCIAVFQITAIDEACKRTGKTEAEVKAYLDLIGHKRIEHILKSEFQDFLKWANSTPKPKPPEIAGVKPASKIGRTPQVAMKHLFATANELQIPEGDVKTCAYTKFQVDSMTKLSTEQLDWLTSWVKDVAQAAQES